MNEQEELELLRKKIDDFHVRVSRYEMVKQDLRGIQSKLDNQIDKFTRIHQYAQKAFHVQNENSLYELICEGVVDIFQLELGAMLCGKVGDKSLTVLGSCNIELDQAMLQMAPGWEKEWGELFNYKRQKALYESPVTDAFWGKMHLSSVIYMPYYDNNQNWQGIIMGGIGKEDSDFFDFAIKEILSPFMVYCQQMNGINNNLEAVRSAKEAGHAKTRFFANLSHEIRTPMNAIIGMAQIASRSTNFADVKRYVEQIDISSRHLLGLLNNVLDISKIEEGKLEIDHIPFSLRAEMDALLISVGPNAVEKQQTIQIDYHNVGADAFLGDALRLKQVLLNLLSNSIKFTHEGGEISIDIREMKRDESKALIKFSVTDNGIGIKPEFSERVFVAFEQEDGSISRKYGGSGLGLAISQRIMELLGGQIQVKSPPNSGACFYFSIWLALDTTAVGAQVVSDNDSDTLDFSGFNLLVVDDVEINREILSAFLTGTGIHMDTAENGQQAVDVFLNSEENFYDLILMDVQMPIMDGCTATRLIRGANRSDAAKVVILALTANVFKEDVQEVVHAGMNGHIGKPVEYETVMNKIKEVQSLNNHM